MSLHMELEERLAAFKAHRSHGGVPERLHRELGHRVGDPDQGRRHHLRRAEPRQHHRRLPPEPRRDSRSSRTRTWTRRAKILRELPAAQRKLLITDGVFSMDGDLGPLPGLCAAAEEYGAIMMVDDAHASGVFGRNGRGTIDHFGMHGRVDVQVGTLSKGRGRARRLRRGQPRADRLPPPPAPGRSFSRRRIRPRWSPRASRPSTS